MSETPVSPDILRTPLRRRVWLNYALRMRGETFSSIARALGCSHSAVSQVAVGYPVERIERALAAAVGLAPAELFPEHYEADGRRVSLTTVSAHRRKGTRGSARVHAGNTEVA